MNMLDQREEIEDMSNGLTGTYEKEMSEMLDVQTTATLDAAPKPIRKSSRAKKIPGHLVDGVTVGTPTEKNSIKKPVKQIRVQLYSDFKCDHCGSRYVVNPMRRGNKVSVSKYKAAPRHKIDPETQKILTLCNACGLKFGRAKKDRTNKVEISEEEQEKFVKEGERFGKELVLKLQNENASVLFCATAKKTACGCIQRFICGADAGDEPVSFEQFEEILERAQLLLNFVEKAAELKKIKCYDPNTLDTKPGKRNIPKIGLGNGHRKSKEFEEFVLSKRVFLRNDVKLCEKATQKILSYSNNFLHKRMKTDPDKGIRVERQKGKAAMGMLKPIEDLPLEPCCADNCVRMALTHGRLLEVWRERAVSGQVEARRVLAEMLTPSGGNRANCYKFISWVTGCSNTTIGKVNEQMKNTGGDREPPEHGLKKYWRYNPKNKKVEISQSTFVPSYQILQTAASSAGLSNMMQDLTQQERSIEPQPQTKKTKRKQNKQQKGGMKGNKLNFTHTNSLENTIKIVENAEQPNTNLSNFPSAVIALNGHFQNNGGFISIPAGLTSENAITIPNTVSIQALQQQIQQQHQTQLQLQIQLLQQQLQHTQNTAIRQTNEGATEYIVTPNPMEQNTQVQSVGTPVVVQTVATSQVPIMHNFAAQTLVQNAVNTESVIPTIVATSNSNMDFLTSAGNVSILHPQNTNVGARTAQNISLVASPLRSSGEISIIAQNNPGSISVLNTPTQLAETPTNTIETYRQVHLIATQSAPTMAVSQPVTISIQTSSIPLSTFPTMLLTQSTSHESHHHHHQQQQQHQQHQHQQLIIQQSASQRMSDQLLIQRALTAQQNAANQIVVQPSTLHNLHSHTAEHTVALSNSVLPPITSFNADAFLTNNETSSHGGTTYAVVSNASLSEIQSRQMLDEQEQTGTMQVSFISS